jgi:hypothetical protein
VVDYSHVSYERMEYTDRIKRDVLTRMVTVPSMKMQYSPIFSRLSSFFSLFMTPKGKPKTGDVEMSRLASIILCAHFDSR